MVPKFTHLIAPEAARKVMRWLDQPKLFCARRRDDAAGLGSHPATRKAPSRAGGNRTGLRGTAPMAKRRPKNLAVFGPVTLFAS